MEFKGTEGKWYSSYDSGFIKVFSNDTGRNVLDCYHKEMNEANALLMSKAPEMLKELKHAAKVLKTIYSFGATAPIIERWEKLIKEATELKTKPNCKHENVKREDGLDECLDCGVRNY